MSDDETGMMVLKMVYRAGFTNPWHSHTCAHGVYVLEGQTLRRSLLDAGWHYPETLFCWHSWLVVGAFASRPEPY